MSVVSWIGRRAEVRHLHGHQQVSAQRRLALWMTVFSAVRTVAWVVAMLLIGAYYAHIQLPFLTGFVTLASTVLFVTLISFYCNASTDAANLAASIAALFSADAHHDAETTRSTLSVRMQDIEADILRLADLRPGPEATRLAADIRSRIQRGIG